MLSVLQHNVCFSENKQFYSDFNHIREKDIHIYLNDREYNLNVVDVIPYVTANAMNTSLSILQWSSQYSFDPLKKHATGRSSGKNYLRLQNWWPLQRHLKRGSSQWLEDRRWAWNSSLLIYPNDLITTDSLFLLILTKSVFSPLITSSFILLCCQEKNL